MGFFPQSEDELTIAARAVLKGDHVKIFAKCDNCPEMGETSQVNHRPVNWVAADIENAHGRVSLVLCPACGEAKLGSLLPKQKEAPSAG